MAEKEDATLAKKEKDALHVLGYMLFRMGLFERSERVYKTLVKVAPQDAPDTLAHAALAAIAVQKNDGANALKELRFVLDGGVISDKKTPYLLMKAQAFWILERKDEAKSVIDEYLYLVGK